MLAVERSSALGLFQLRAQRAGGDFALTRDSLPVVTELCHRLAGLPLAIELAAARVAALPPEELLGRLGEHLDRHVVPEGVPRQRQTVWATIDWTFQLLDPVDQSLFAAMAVFAGGSRLEAVEAVWRGGGDGEAPVPEGLGRLVDARLLQVEADPDGQTRYLMLDSVHAFAVERLEADPATDDIMLRHAAHYAEFAERAAVEFAGPDQVRSLDLIGREHHNLRVVLARTLAAGDAQTAARVGSGIWAFWITRGHVTEGRHWLDQVLAAGPTLPTALLARVLYSAGSIALDQGDVRGAQVLVQDSLTWARAADARVTMMQALRKLSRIHSAAGDYERARALCTESLELARAADDERCIAEAVVELGDITIRLGLLDEAREIEAEALQRCRALGNTFCVLACVGSLGQVMLFQGDLQAARPLIEENLALCREVGDVSNEAEALYHLGVLADLQDDRPAATHLLAASLSLRYQMQQPHSVAESLEALAGAVSHRDPVTAARWLGVAEALRDRHELPRPPVWQPYWETHVARLHDRLEESVMLAAWAAGRESRLDEVMAQALALGSDQPA